MKKALFSLLMLCLVQPSLAHHSFYAEFDPNLEITLEGEVVRMRFVNPHSWLEFKVINEAGEEEIWMVEGGSPNVMMRKGWSRNTLPPGTRIKVTGFGAKDGSHRMSSRGIEFPDGTVMDMGGTQKD